ncbi:uncharacterized protein EI90DRAFT_3153955 [Cantharellus anzutake]|uniref:uncharacterized protein n=1 Tax=Cantharellus anzutake TaxID=1750568 RepID=UPI0019059F46|nr:uncharacterized protein EI90DRAFT_3153955 [Cantharellus anzutake]KAF8332576.1 hypothetical protein EI90DRAFT_3153955 [Cantharellus anzutake]
MDEFDRVLDALLDTVTPDNVPEDTILALNLLVSHTVVAALDLLDKKCVTRYDTPGGRKAYIVSGSTDSYAVEIDVFRNTPPSALENDSYTTTESRLFRTPRHFCTCPAFAYTVLLRSPRSPLDDEEEELSPLVCKHVLAVLLASRLHKWTVRTVSFQELDGIYTELFASPT